MVVCKTIQPGSTPGGPSNYLVYIRVTSITFLIKWFNAIFSELIPRFESERKFHNNTFIAVPIINLG